MRIKLFVNYTVSVKLNVLQSLKHSVHDGVIKRIVYIKCYDSEGLKALS